MQSFCARLCRYTFIAVVIAAVFIAIAFGATRATQQDSASSLQKSFKSNGTHNYAPTTILVSLDGFRADFLQRDLTPTLNGFIREGVSPLYMLPSFPTVTFPNHYTLVTGLYPESHGVVGNSFWDPELQEEFYYTHPSAMQSKWWKGEPLWVTAERQGVRVATHMWPGSEAHVGDMEPAFVDKFNGSELLDLKVDRILNLLDKPGPDMAHSKDVVDDQRPQLIIAYVPNVDADGHRYGPNSTEIRGTIQSVDTMLASLLSGLSERNLTEIVNVVVVSDHGMATTSTDRVIQFEELINPDLVDHIDGWPHYGLRPKDPSIVDMMYDHLVKEADERDGFDVYTKETMPERYHFANNERIAPLWIIPHTGWAIVTHEEFNVSDARKNGDVYTPRGLHGYDFEHPLMRSIFIARGPSFPHQPGSKVDFFQNTEVYNILCDSIGVKPNPNNGTLRLPLMPVGLHGEDILAGETPVDDFPSTTTTVAQSAETAPAGESDATNSTSSDDFVTSSPVGKIKDLATSWLDWFHDRISGVKDWVSDQFSGKYNGHRRPTSGGNDTSTPVTEHTEPPEAQEKPPSDEDKASTNEDDSAAVAGEAEAEGEESTEN